MAKINEFIASMAKARGFARASQYEVRFSFPPELTIIEKNFGQQLSLHCDSISMPGHDLTTQKRQYGSEPARDMVTGHGYEGLIQSTFYLDSKLNELQVFEQWQALAANTSTNKANYYDDYVGTMEIYQMGSAEFKNNMALSGQNSKGSQTGTKIDAQDFGVPLDDFPVSGLRLNIKEEAKYAIRVNEVYPATIADIEYAYGSKNTVLKVNVGWNYRNWKNITHKLSSFELHGSAYDN